MINLVNEKYPNKINHNTNRSLYNLVKTKIFEDEIQTLVDYVQGESKEIETNDAQIKELKKQIHQELQEFDSILQSVISYRSVKAENEKDKYV